MIERIIRWSAANRLLVLLAAAFLTVGGLFAVSRTPLDALPDLSDVQVIIRTPYPGQAPQIVESQVTYPIATTMLSAPKVKAVRAFSLFGDSFVTVIFDDGTDLYWARSRTLEYLNQATGRLPPGITPALGPDATGVGWAYEYALVDRSGQNDLGQLRALQDWFLKYQLKEVPGVAEVASVGGMVRAFQVQVEPEKLQLYRVSVGDVMAALKTANNETGGSVIERGEAEYMIRVGGYLESLDDFRDIPLKVSAAGVPVTIGDVAKVQIVPDFRRGIAELNGEGEVAGGVIVVRAGADTRSVIEAVKAKLDALKPALPRGVEVVTVYDRTSVIDRAVNNLWEKLGEEFLVVAVVCVLFLLHLRSALVAIITLPLGVLAAFIIMYFQGINANILSLGGIALAIGAMVDAAVVMIENAHKKLEHAEEEQGGMTEALRRTVLVEAAVEVGPALFFSLLIITLSFLPVFSLEAQEGRLFKPLALTKTYSMAAAAALSITLIPVLMVMFVKGRIRREADNPINRFL
ncbi:MAG: efflux RND transporter permease subunit, partial [Pseudomonadota bacterium]